MRVPRRRRPWRLVGVAVLGVGVVGALAWRPMLGAVASLLIQREARGEAVTALLLPEALGARAAADALAGEFGAGRLLRVLLIELPPGRAVEEGLVPAPVSLMERALKSRGVSAGAVERLPAPVSKAHGALEGEAVGGVRAGGLDALGAWLEAHPGERVVLFTELLATAHARELAERALGPEAASRLTVAAFDDASPDADGWWRTRAGQRDVLRQLARRLQLALVGVVPSPAPSETPEEHLARLLGPAAAPPGAEP